MLSKKIIILIVSIVFLSACSRKTVHQVTPSAPQPIQLAQAPARKKPEKMTFEEALTSKTYYDKNKYEDLSIKCAQRMIALGTDQEEIRKVTLELAEIFLKNADYEKAQKYASDYQLLYPGTPQAIDAAYIAIKANFYDTLSADRDQTKTHTTLELAQNFIKKHEKTQEENQQVKDYVVSIKDMTEACYRKLLKSELNVVNTYLAKFDYTKHEAPLKSAHNRITYIKDKLLPHVKDQEPEILHVEIMLAQAGSKTDVVNQKKLELNTKFPEYSEGLAQRLKKIALMRF